MSGIHDVAEEALLKLLFTAVTWADIAEDHVATPITIIAWALHTTPGLVDANPQDTLEAAYTGYARETPNRVAGAGGHTVTAGSMSPTEAVTFTVGSAGGETVTHCSVGKTVSGSTDVFFSGTVTPNIVTGNGITPELTTASTVTLD